MFLDYVKSTRRGIKREKKSLQLLFDGLNQWVPLHQPGYSPTKIENKINTKITHSKNLDGDW